MTAPLKITVWNEYRSDRRKPAAVAHYPRGIHAAIAEFLCAVPDFSVRTATLDEPQHGLSEEVLTQTDVLLWWGHSAHDEVKDEVAARVQKHVLAGMGLIVLHSGHLAKPFLRLLGTSGVLRWRMATDKERLWNLLPSHPITAGIGDFFELPNEEMYGEPFDIPPPEELLFVSWFSGGEVFRSGATWRRGNGRIFYFRPGHETVPTYYNANVQRVLINAVRWARPELREHRDCVAAAPLEPLPPG